MIKGKFYSGLPSEMMARSKAVNRQATHFFWPDESDAESVTPRSRRTTSKSTPISTNNNNNNQTNSAQTDFTPRDLFRKQLSSGIEFYDNVNAKTPESRRRRFKKIDNINLNNNNDTNFQPEKKKLETFSSKIEFYDFEHENNAKNEKPVKSKMVNETRKEEIKTINESPEVAKKRISFQEKPVEKTKSILKNSEEKSQVEKVLVKPLPKRGLLPKNLSKSVENISKMAKNFDETDAKTDKKSEKLSAIIKEVKNMNLSHDRPRTKLDDYDREDRDPYYRGADRIETRRNYIERDYGSQYPDRYDDRGYRDSEYRYRNEERNESYKPNRRFNDYDDRGDRDGYVDRRYERSQRISYSQPRDSYEYRERTRRIEESPIRSRDAPIRRDYDRDYDQNYEIESRRGRVTPTRDAKPISRKPIDPYYEEQPIRTTRRDDSEYSSCISRKPKIIPQHLRTNILFNGRVQPQAQRPISVRNSAVTRVGVGLPDIE